MNEYKTSQEFLKEIDLSTTPIREIGVACTMQFIVYECNKCQGEFKLTYKDWEERFKEQVTLEVKNRRKSILMSSVNLRMTDPDNGISYCGKCEGYDGEGNCLNDIIRQCPIKDE